MNRERTHSPPGSFWGLFWTTNALAVLLLGGLAACSGGGGGGSQNPGAQGATVTIDVKNDLIRSNVRRLSLNVGRNDPFDAAHLLKNKIVNPGFEDSSFASICQVAVGATGERIPQAFYDASQTDDSLMRGWPEGFWDGAQYEFLSGPARGRAGTIDKFLLEGDENVFYLDTDGTAPVFTDVFAVTTRVPGFFRDFLFPKAQADPSTTRPGSPGSQAMRLAPSTNDLPSFFQRMDSSWGGPWESSGKLILVRGNWRFEVWAKGTTTSDTLRVRFHRDGETSFLDETVTLDTDWNQYVFDFFVADGADSEGPYGPAGPHPELLLDFLVPSAASTVWVDDAVLERTDDANPTAFADPYVERVREYAPTVLRALGRQFGSDLENALAEPFARKTAGWSYERRFGQHYDYSLHEFLELCVEVGAVPWYVVPTTWSRQDLADLIAYLAAPAGIGETYADVRADLGQAQPWTEVFETIHLEYGDEAWGSGRPGDPFVGASVGGAAVLGRIVEDRFGVLRASPHFEADRFDLIVGANVNTPQTVIDIEAGSTNHDTIAVAPYFGRTLDFHDTDEEIYQPLFARAFEDVTTGNLAGIRDLLDAGGQGTGLALYEFSFHTTRNELLPIEVRNAFVTGANGALALPLYPLVYMRSFETGPMCAFTSLRYQFPLVDGSKVRLWGLLRDTESTGRKRPGWLGLEAVNRAIRGDLITTVHSGDITSWRQEPINEIENTLDVEHVQSFAFRDGSSLALVVFNLSLDEAIQVQVNLPGPVVGGATCHLIAAPDIRSTNEEEEEVQIETFVEPEFASGQVFELPPHSLEVLLWSE